MANQASRHNDFYSTEHHTDAAQPRPSRRLDLSTFFTNINELDTSANNTQTEGHPTQIAATLRLLANSYQVQRGETQGVVDTRENPSIMAPDGQGHGSPNDEMLEYMIHTLVGMADEPPKALQGVPQTFLDGLERVPKPELRTRHARLGSDNCPICTIPFVEDEYPLVVRLPCHQEHVFDMECIAPWLKTNTTCPLCRTALVKEEKKETQEQTLASLLGPHVAEEDDDAEYNDMYG